MKSGNFDRELAMSFLSKIAAAKNTLEMIKDSFRMADKAAINKFINIRVLGAK